jgi:predicted ATPase
MGALLLETLATLNEVVADDEILTRGDRGPVGWCTPELLRIRGKRLFRSDKENNPMAAEALLMRSLDAARQQEALSWELRSAMSVAELWQAQGRRDAALNLLASVRDRFTEGFATTDLVRSDFQLGELRSSA